MKYFLILNVGKNRYHLLILVIFFENIKRLSISMLKRLGNLLLQGMSSANTIFDPDLETDEFFMGNINFVERAETKPTLISRSWILNSGTNVGDKLARYVDTIPEAQK